MRNIDDIMRDAALNKQKARNELLGITPVQRVFTSDRMRQYLEMILRQSKDIEEMAAVLKEAVLEVASKTFEIARLDRRVAELEEENSLFAQEYEDAGTS